MTMMDMIFQNKINEENKAQHTPTSDSLSIKIEELNQSVTEVQKYELLTTNQYLQQMELILQILIELSTTQNSETETSSNKELKH